MLQGLIDRAKSPVKLAEYQADIYCPPAPQALYYLWTAFNRLRRRKGSNGFGASPIGWPDIDAFVRNTKCELAPWEVEIIEDLDDLFLMDHTKSQIEID